MQIINYTPPYPPLFLEAVNGKEVARTPHKSNG